MNPVTRADAGNADRYIALQNDQNGEGPLREYFKGETLHHSKDAYVPSTVGGGGS